MITLGGEYGFPFWEAQGRTFLGGALVIQERWKEGMAYLKAGLTAGRETGAGIDETHFLCLLAGAQGKVDQIQEGLKNLAEAFVLMDKTEERIWTADLYRVRGELLQQKAKNKRQKAKGVAEAETCYRKAITVARRQKTKSLELRAAMSLARLWQEQGKTEQAYRRLSKVYGWFTEGFASKDLQDAKALLAELSREG